MYKIMKMWTKTHPSRYSRAGLKLNKVLIINSIIMIIIEINNKTYATIVNHDKLLGSNTFIADRFDSMTNRQYSLLSD